MKKKVLAILVVTLGLNACGSSQVSYAPYAWGQSGYCYYLYSPYECWGHHPGVPTPMPLWWHERYANYYDSPAYIDTYVPNRYRSTAVYRSKSFDRTYHSAITQASARATWRSSSGKTVSGTKVSRSSLFGSGGGMRSTGGSSGSIRRSSSGNPCARVAEPSRYLLASTVDVGLFKSSSGSSFRSSSSSFRSSGSARSSGSRGVGSKSGSRSGSNC